MIANPSACCGQLHNRENELFPVRSRVIIWPREVGSTVPSHSIPLTLHTQRLNLVSSITPGDARTLANPTCGASARLVNLYSSYLCVCVCVRVCVCVCVYLLNCT